MTLMFCKVCAIDEGKVDSDNPVEMVVKRNIFERLALVEKWHKKWSWRKFAFKDVMSLPREGDDLITILSNFSHNETSEIYAIYRCLYNGSHYVADIRDKYFSYASQGEQS